MSANARTNHTIPCTSPLLKWSPAKEQGNIWNLTYTDSSWSTYQPNTRGQGRPGHTSSLNGSSANFGWTGGDLWFYGQVEDGSEVGVGYEVVCDGEKGRAYVFDNDEGNLLGGCRGLKEGQHEAKLILDGSRNVQLWRVTWESTESRSESKSVNNTANALQDDGSLNPFFTSSEGTWEPRLNIFGREDNSPSPQIPYPRIITSTPNSALTLFIPTGSTAVYIMGTINYDHASFSVQMGQDGANKVINNGKSSWGDIEQVLFYSELDPEVDNTRLLVTNLGTNSSTSFDISKVIWVTVEKENKSALSVGGIVGVTVCFSVDAPRLDSIRGAANYSGGNSKIGGIIALGLLAFAVGLFLKRRKRRIEEERRRTWGEVDLTDGQLEDVAGNKHGADVPNQSIQPFLVNGNEMTVSATSAKGARSDPTGPSQTSELYRDDPTLSNENGYDSYALHTPQVRANPDVPSTSGPSSSSSYSRPLVNALHVAQETDAGPLTLETTIPPRYDDRWHEARSENAAR